MCRRSSITPMSDTLERLRHAAESDPTAQLMLARALYAANRHDEALAALSASAKRGQLDALTELGARMATGAGAPLAPEDGRALLRFAADSGAAPAARHLAVLAGAGMDAAPDWPHALSWTARAAAAGDADARAELRLLAGEHAAAEAPDWAALADHIDLAPWLAHPSITPLSVAPEIVVLPGLAPTWLCDRLIAAGCDALEAAGVTDRLTGEFTENPARTNRFAQVKLFDCGLPLLLLRARMAAVAGAPLAHCEIMNLLSYEPGQAFDVHHDYLDPAEPGFDEELARDGQRIATVLVYLSDDYAGGETDFPQAGVRFRGATGDGLMFRNVDAAGRIDRATLHAGLSPTAGRKWVLSQWVRDRPQRQI